jgi:hypothetical protein
VRESRSFSFSAEALNERNAASTPAVLLVEELDDRPQLGRDHVGHDHPPRNR